jgi:hypothetical protein
LLAQIHAAAVEACRSERGCLMIKRWDTPGYSRDVRDVDHVKEGVMRQHGEQFVDGEWEVLERLQSTQGPGYLDQEIVRI